LPQGEHPVGYFCGAFLPPAEIRLPLNDLGISQGVMLADQLRTFAGRPLLLDRHLQRLEAGAQALSIPLSLPDLGAAIRAVVEHNVVLMEPDQDLRISVLITPGERAGGSPTVAVTTSVLPFRQIRDWYESGIQLVMVPTREIPGESIPRYFKHRNRIHYWLAEQQARLVNVDARALLLDSRGNVCEGTTGSVAWVSAEGSIVVPPKGIILDSISLETSLELLQRLPCRVVRREFTIDEMNQAREVLWFSSPACLAPVTKLNGSNAGMDPRRPVFSELLHSWSAWSGIDLMKQSRLATEKQ
jgi:branched-subunit amino acid aminotransferase/4-amino-4-deoxychorismate lyase